MGLLLSRPAKDWVVLVNLVVAVRDPPTSVQALLQSLPNLSPSLQMGWGSRGVVIENSHTRTLLMAAVLFFSMADF